MNYIIKLTTAVFLFATSCVILATAVPNTMPPTPSSVPTSAQPAVPTPTPPAINANGYILIDANSGAILAQKNANKRMAPASLTKLMSMYIISGAIANGQIHYTDLVPISVNAWRTGGSRMFVKAGSSVPVNELIKGIIVASGNDATTAMAEYVGGNEQTFVDMMNKMATTLGMQHTHYMDPTGLPNPDHYTTPYDIALLTRAIINNYPGDYQWYSQKWITYNHIKQPNRNRLLWHDPTVDGLKTGHTNEAGFCLVASAVRNGMRLIAVIMGAPTDSGRANDAQALLNYGYRYFETHKLYVANAPLNKQRVWMGSNKQVQLGLNRDLYVTIPNGQYNKLQANLVLNSALHAPIQKGEVLGKVQIMLNNQVINSQPLVALADDPRGGFFSQLSDHFALFFNRWFSKV